MTRLEEEELSGKCQPTACLIRGGDGGEGRKAFEADNPLCDDNTCFFSFLFFFQRTKLIPLPPISQPHRLPPLYYKRQTAATFRPSRGYEQLLALWGVPLICFSIFSPSFSSLILFPATHSLHRRGEQRSWASQKLWRNVEEQRGETGWGKRDNKLKHKAHLLADVSSLLFAFISLWKQD